MKKNTTNLLIGAAIGAIGTYVVLMAMGKLNTTGLTLTPGYYSYPVQPSPPRTLYPPGGTRHGYTYAVINA